MRSSIACFRQCLLLGITLVIAVISVASPVNATPAPVIIQYGLDPDRDDKDDEIRNPGATLDGYGVVGSVLSGWANRAVARENYRNTTITLELAEGVDFDVLVQEHWRCFGLPDDAETCRKLVINGPNGFIGDPDDIDPASNTHAIAISIIFNVEWMRGVQQHVGANIRVFLLESDGEEYKIADQFVHWYKSGAPEDIKQAPFYLKPSSVGPNETKKRAKSRAYWFDDGAEPIKALVEDVGTQFPALLDTMFKAMVTENGELDFKAWYKSLDRVNKVYDKKAVYCPRDLCSYSIVSLNNADKRHWLVKPYVRVPIIRTVPCDWLGCAAADAASQ